MLRLRSLRRRKALLTALLVLLTSTGFGMWSRYEFTSPSVQFTRLAIHTQQRMTRLLQHHLPHAIATAFFNGATLTVNSTADTDDNTDALLTLREAMLITNGTRAVGANEAAQVSGTPGSGLDNIVFNLGAGTPTISPSSSLPTITNPVSINGNTGGSTRVELDGTNAGVSADGLTISAGSSTVAGMVINRFKNYGIHLVNNSGSTIKNCYIGTDASGTTAQGNKGMGVFIESSTNNTIGGTTGSERNIISGNNVGVYVLANSPGGNKVIGNYIGVDVNGTAALGNTMGIRLSSINTQVGGTTAGERNIISGNATGISVEWDNNKISGNYIGTDVNGTTALGNSNLGIILEGSNNIIGGTTVGERNIISGSKYTGVYSDGTFTGNKIIGNYIGTDVNGTPNMGNGGGGVVLFSPYSSSNNGNTIGGTTAGAGNLIAGNSLYGVLMAKAGTVGNPILGNSIFSNSGLGIDLTPNDNTDADGVTANDTLDADTGGNNLQNFPVISSAVTSASSTNIQGMLNSRASTSFRIEFFVNDACDSSGNGEGQTFLGSTTVTTNASGDATINTTIAQAVAAGKFITATATKLDGSGNPVETSEFSACRTVNTAPVVASDAGSKLFIARYGNQNRIARANVDGSGLNANYFVVTGNPIGVAVDTVGGKIFWSQYGAGQIGCANLDGSNANEAFITGLAGPIGLAIDAVNRKIYWAEDGGSRIRRANIDGTNVVTLVGATNAYDVALDVPNNKLYYCRFGSGLIGRADLDGSNNNASFINTGSTGFGVYGVGLDLVNSKIYWASYGTKTVGCANLNGTSINNSLITLSGDGPSDVTVDPVGGKIYWSEVGSVGRANLDGTSANETFLSGLGVTWGIALADTDNEGAQATRTGTYSDADGDAVTLSANIGTVQKDVPSAGKWTWTYTPPDGPATLNVTITATDSKGAASTTSFTVNVNNIAPTATFAASSAKVNENTASPPTVSFTNPVDPGTPDATTLHYSYDYNNDGVWEVGDGTYAGSGTAASQTILASYFAAPAPTQLVVKGRIIDKDGGYTDYTATININHAPTAINGPLVIVEDFDYGNTGGSLAGQNGGAGFSTAWDGGGYTATGLTFSNLSSPGGAWNGSSGSRNFAKNLAAAGPITGDFLFSMNSAPGGRVQMFGLGGFNNQGFTLALAPANDSTPNGGIPIVGLQGGGFANITSGAVALNTTYLYRFAYANSSITAWILSAAQYDNFAPGGITDAELNVATIGSGATEVTGRVTKAGNVTSNMANLFTYTFGGSGVTMDRLRMTGQPVGSSLVIAENQPVNTTVGTLLASDPDANETHTFELVDSVNYPDNNSFTITGNTVKSNAVFNYEAKNSYSIRVKVTDSGGLMYETTLTVSITNVNEQPTVANTIANQTATAALPFNFTFAANTFADVDVPTNFTYTATKSNGSALPAWLTFTPGTRTFSGTPAVGDAGTFTVKVTATDDGAPTMFTSTTFDITVNTPTLSVSKSNPALTYLQNATYTITVTNTGAGAAATATVKDALPSGMKLVSATGTNWTCSPASGSAPVSTITCTFSSTANPIATSGGTSTINIVACPIVGGSLTNKVAVDPNGGTAPPNPTTCTGLNAPTTGCGAPITASVSGAPTETISKSGTAGATPVGGNGATTINWLINYGVSNTAPIPSVTLNDTWSSGQTLVGTSVLTPGGLWSTNQPNSTSLNFSNALVAPNGKGQTQAFPRPLANGVNLSGTGDGYNPAITANGKVIGINHHTANAAIWCYDLNTGAPCTGYPKSSGITTGTVNTTLAIGNRVYMNPDSYDGQCCGVTGLDNIYCWDATTDSTCGQSPATTGKSSLLTLANNKLFTLNQSGQLRCFDPGNGLNNCAGFTTVNLGMPGRGGVSSWEPYGDDMFAVGSKLYVANYERKLTCFDIATNTTCAGWPALPTVLTPAVPASGGSNLFPRLSAGGTITGICVAGTDTDATCYNLDSSNPVVVSLGGVHKMHPGLNANADVFVGSRVFFANFVYSTGLTCFDWATQAPCTGTGFSPAGFTNSTANNAYGLGTDGVSVFSYGDGAVLQSWNPLSGVTPSNRVATIATVNIDSFYCGATAPVAATWDKVMLSDVNLTAGVEFNSLLVSVIDTSTGTTVFGPTEAVGTSGVFDISGVSSALRTLRLQIDESPVNTVAWDDGVPPKGTLTFTNSTPVQFCYQTQVTCTGSGVSYTNTIATNIDARSATAQVTACAPSPNLALTKSDPSPSLLIGQNSTYTLTITNNGNANATTATVKDTLPTGLDLVSASGTNWTCAPSGATSSPVGTITCNFSGSMVKNGGTSTINIVAKPILGYGNSTVINYASVDPSGSTNPPLPTNCTAANTPAGCAAPVSSVIPPNSPPTINAGTTVMRAQGAAGSGATIATVSDNETAKKDLVVSVMSAPAGISVTSISAPDATTGAVTATVAAACNAVLGDNMVVLKVTDSGTLTAIANLTVNVTPHNLATTALSGQNVFAGATVMFSTTASGSGPYSFVWKKGAAVLSSGIATNGATSTLTLTSVQAADAATYSVEVTGACTTVTQSATLGVTTPTLSINNVMKNEGNSGNTSFDFTVTLSPASTQTVTVNYATANHTATAPDDFTVIPSTPLTFQPNETMKTISVQVKGETTVETDEIFYLNLSSPANATLSNNQGTGTIINDDGARLSINDVTVTEGNSGTTNAVFNVTLDNPSALPITVKYATADQTATVANNDYTPVSNTLMFPPNSTLQTITVPVKGDTAVELNETFVVNLSGVSGAVIAKAQGTGTIKNDDGVLPDLTVGLIDPAVCLSPSGLVGVTATVFNPNNTTVNATWTAMFPTQLIGLIGSGTATVNQAGIQVTTTQVTWTGTLTAGQSVTFGYQAQIAANTPPDMLLCIQNTASFNGGTQVQVPECFVANCPATGLLPLANVRTSDQKAGSLLVFPYYTSRVATNSDTRLSITNTGTQQAYVHLFLVDGTSCDAADFFLCLTPNATASFKTSEYDPESTGFLYAVAVDTQGRPVPNNGLIGNAFVRDGNYVDNYAAEAFWRYDANPTTISNGVALLHLNGGIYDAAPMQFSVEIQSPLDTVGQRIVVAPISGDLTNGTGNLNSTNPTLQTAASQVGIGLASNEQEKTVSFSALLSGGCLKSAVIGTTFPRVPNGLGNLISTGKAGLLQFRVGAGVGLLMTPRTGANKWYGIRTLHKTAMTNTVIAIPVFIPVC